MLWTEVAASHRTEGKIATVHIDIIRATFFLPRLPLSPESVEILSLELITLTVKSLEAETVRGVRVTVSGTCQVKVDAFTQQDLDQNLPQITLACQHFLGKVGGMLVDERLGQSVFTLSSLKQPYKPTSRGECSFFCFSTKIPSCGMLFDRYGRLVPALVSPPHLHN